MDYINDLHDLCETISREISDANEKIRSAGGKVSAGDVDYIDKLTHSLKSIKATIAMMEDENGDSNAAYPMGTSRRTYPRTYSRNSYARGRMRAPRDSMGRYSRADGYADDLRSMADEAPTESIRRDLQRIVEKMEQM